MSPTQRTLKRLRDAGWFCAIVEKWNPHAKVRQDLFGFIDVLAFKGDTILAVQCTSGAHVAERVRKIAALPQAALWLTDTRQIHVWGWSKQGPRGKRKTWQCRVESLDALRARTCDHIGYPLDWPKCQCGQPVLDGHRTCGRIECGPP